MENLPGSNNLTPSQFKWGYWYFQHKDQIKQYIVYALIAVNVILFGYSGYGLVRELAFDGPGLEQAQQELTQQLIDVPSIHQASQPLPISVVSTDVLSSGGQNYDFMARISNPNEDWMISSLSYQFIAEGFITDVKTTYVLPGEEKYIVELGIESERAPRRPRLEIRDIEYRRVLQYANIKAERLNFDITDVEFISAQQVGIGETVPISRTKFRITNNSAFNFYRVPIVVVLSRGTRLVGVNRITLEGFMSGESRPVEISWFETLVGVNKTLIEPQVNILDKTTFVEFRGGPAEFFPEIKERR